MLVIPLPNTQNLIWCRCLPLCPGSSMADNVIWSALSHLC